MNRPAPDPVTAQARMPWLTAVLVKWTCMDAVGSRRSRLPMPPRRFAMLRARLWNAVSHATAGTPDTSGQLMMRRMLNAQLPFQTNRPSSFLLVPILLARLEPNHGLRRRFRESIGMDERTFVDLALFFHEIIGSGRTIADLALLDEATSFPPEATRAFARLLARTPSALGRSLGGAGPTTDRKVSELLDFPVIARYPFLRDGTRLRCWHPALYHHGVPEAVHHALEEGGKVSYVDSYGREFEKHVVDLAKGAGGRWLSEKELRAALPAGSQVNEGLLSFDRVNVLIEAKARGYRQDTVTAGTRRIVADKTYPLGDALRQGRATSAGLRRGGPTPPTVRDAERDYLLIVTSSELVIGTGTQLVDLYPQHKLEVHEAGAGHRLPLERVFVMSIDDYEWLMQAASLGQLSLPTFLDECVARNARPETAMFLMAQHLERTGPRLLSPTVVDALTASRRRVRAALDVARGGADGRSLAPWASSWAPCP